MADINEIVQTVQQNYGIVGRSKELRQLVLAKLAEKHAVIEGPVGVGKTTLAHAVAAHFDQEFIRIDGDERYTEAKLVGYFEPPLVVEKGWNWDSFVSGPLTLAMKNGSVLFINEANRLLEGTQNVLLPTLDESVLIIPKLGVVNGEKGFFVVATQNPESYIGTTVLSEALRDRFVWVKLEHQDYEDELGIVLGKLDGAENSTQIAEVSAKIARSTRKHPDIRRGASVRGAIDLSAVLVHQARLELETIIETAIMALATKVELEDGVDRPVEEIIAEIVEKTLSGEDSPFL
ncbi:MAG: AAA family ATPase [Candidatus Heimdallarchaeota archaeon]